MPIAQQPHASDATTKASAPIETAAAPEQELPAPAPAESSKAAPAISIAPESEKPDHPDPGTAANEPEAAAENNSPTRQAPQTAHTVPAPRHDPLDEANTAAPEIMTNGPLTLQAISWSPSPENRMAVVSDRIIREGDSIDGFRIEAINDESVLVTKDGNTWRLVFTGR